MTTGNVCKEASVLMSLKWDSFNGNKNELSYLGIKLTNYESLYY